MGNKPEGKNDLRKLVFMSLYAMDQYPTASVHLREYISDLEKRLLDVTSEKAALGIKMARLEPRTPAPSADLGKVRDALEGMGKACSQSRYFCPHCETLRSTALASLPKPLEDQDGL